MPGRNDPCPCQSGKKYKKCCGDPLNEQRSLDAWMEEDCAKGAERLAEYNEEVRIRCDEYKRAIA